MTVDIKNEHNAIALRLNCRFSTKRTRAKRILSQSQVY